MGKYFLADTATRRSLTLFSVQPASLSFLFQNMSTSEKPFQPSYSSCNEVSTACPIEATLYGYRPTLGATALFAAIFALNLVITLVFMVRSRLWSFQAWLSVGLIFEIIGYAGRLMMYQDPWK